MQSNQNQTSNQSSQLIAPTNYSKGPFRKVMTLHPRLVRLMQDYFSIDIRTLPEKSPQELAKFADWAKEMEKWMEFLPIIEQHCKTLIAGQVEYNKFIANVQKEATKGAKVIDKALLDTYLEARGYDLHLNRMVQKAGNEVALQDMGHQYKVQQELSSFESELKLLESQHNYQLAAINDKFLIHNQDLAHKEMLRQADLEEREQEKYELDLVKHGYETANKNRSNTSATRGFGRHVRNFFSNIWSGLSG